MREDEKQALISCAEQLIKHAVEARDEIPFGLGDDVEGELSLIKIAMASLTAVPVGDVIDVGGALLVEWEVCLQEGSQLYTTPPAPSVQTDDHCNWSYDNSNYYWSSSCGEDWIFSDGGPIENRVKYCQGCGKPVRIVEGDDEC